MLKNKWWDRTFQKSFNATPTPVALTKGNVFQFICNDNELKLQLGNKRKEKLAKCKNITKRDDDRRRREGVYITILLYCLLSWIHFIHFSFLFIWFNFSWIWMQLRIKRKKLWSKKQLVACNFHVIIVECSFCLMSVLKKNNKYFLNGRCHVV